MAASTGGSVVDPSLLRQANDRGVTIAFADLDGADGLWVPEERTILVSRKLTEAAVARVIEHEMTHVMIDDQHADLDAGKDVLVGHPPARSRRWAAAALTAAGLLAVVGGATYGIAKATGGPPQEQQFAPTLPGLTASESAGMSPSRGPDGQIVYVTVRASGGAPAAPAPTVSPTGLGSVTPSPSGTAPPPGRPSATVPRPTRSAIVSPSPAPPPVSSNPPVTVEPTPDPTTPEPPPATESSPAPVGDESDDAGPGDTAELPESGGASDVAVATSGGAGSGIDPTG